MKPPPRRLLVVDDDAAHRRMLSEILSDLEVEVTAAENGREALESMQKEAPELVLLDIRMPVMDGLETLAAMARLGLEIPTVVLTAHADLDDAVRAMKLGARDYLRKPIDIGSLKELVERFLGRSAEPLRDHPPLPAGLVFESALMREVLGELARIANSDVPVLLCGETGTGKDVLAGLLHQWSPRRIGPLVAVNVAALPETLVESELFGHLKGAFTGAVADRIGRLEEAQGGTLFLDEIGEMPLALQPKILRAIESRRVARLGGGPERQLDFRLVTATNQDLEREIEANRFRQDLYYRVAVITVEIPPLRERPEDVPALARSFLDGDERRRLSPAAESLLLAYDWPGNIRELRNTMLRASVLAPGDLVLPEHLPPSLCGIDPSAIRPEVSGRSLAAVEKRAILEALERSAGNRTEAARALGISRRKLIYRLKQYREENGP